MKFHLWDQENKTTDLKTRLKAEGVTVSKFVQHALHNPINPERRCWGKEKQLYSESPQVEKTVV